MSTFVLRKTDELIKTEYVKGMSPSILLTVKEGKLHIMMRDCRNSEIDIQQKIMHSVQWFILMGRLSPLIPKTTSNSKLTAKLV